MAHGGADAPEFACDYGRTDTAAADDNAPVSLAVLDGPGDRGGEIGVIVGRVEFVCAQVSDLVAERTHQLCDFGLYGVAAVVCPDCHSHFNRGPSARRGLYRQHSRR